MLKYTILILDNEQHTQWTLKTLLEAEGYITIELDTIERVLKDIQEFEVSGMVTEYRIGNYFTLDVIKKLKEKFPEAYVMMITGEQVTEDEYEEIMVAGVDDFFLKPCSSKKILLHLMKGLRHRSLILEKNRLERELGQISTKVGIRDVPRGNEVLTTSSSQSVK
jgi:DNA-binding NtrC family response regulator